jgi:DNA (cytosine-5)-methyltransferase 1
MTVGSLFAGIGGLDLGAERAGFNVIWQCEKDDYCTKILNKHWPDTPVYDDVQTLYTGDGQTPKRPDILCGGFPCQDISYAGKGAGLDGERSGLWWEFARTISVVGPRYVVVENVPALINRGLNAVLGWFATHGYDAEWQIVSAAAMGAPHIRERLFIVAYPDSSRWGAQQRRVSKGKSDTAGKRETMANSDSTGCDSSRRTGEEVFKSRSFERFARCCRSQNGRQWSTQPEVGRLADGVPDRVDRLRGLGNAVVPLVAEFVFRCIRDHLA